MPFAEKVTSVSACAGVLNVAVPGPEIMLQEIVSDPFGPSSTTRLWMLKPTPLGIVGVLVFGETI